MRFETGSQEEKELPKKLGMAELQKLAEVRADASIQKAGYSEINCASNRLTQSCTYK